MENTPRHRNTGKSSWWKRPAIIVPIILAILACIQAVILAILNPDLVEKFIGKATSTPTEVVATASPAQSETPPIVTDTPVSPTSSVTYLPGEDWKQGCIHQQWQIYPFQDIPVDSNGCYQQPIWDYISTYEGGLHILAQHRNMITAKEYGLFVQLPQSANIELTVDLDEIDNGEVWFGVFSRPDLKSEGWLIVAPPGGVKDHAFAIRDMPSQERMDLTKIYSNPAGIYTLGFDLSLGSINAVIENTPREQYAFSSQQRWLFIGYRAKIETGKGSATIEALIKNLEIQAK